MEILQPPDWAKPRGYANGVAASGKLVFISGQIGWGAHCKLVTRDFAGQVRQALENIVTILREAGGKPEHIARMTWYVTDKLEYLSAEKAVGTVYREIMQYHYPAMSVLEVAALIEEDAKVEIEATAVIPNQVQPG
jgi:enamine deaminase RidA (YjgF/YER057c/UK114 family)